PFRRLDIGVVLALEGARLEKADAVAALGKRPDQAAIISGRTVPIGRQQAGAVEPDLHAVSFHSLRMTPREVRIAISSSTRCEQLWRARIVSRPLFARASAKSGSPLRMRI